MRKQETDRRIWATFEKVDYKRDPGDHVIDPVLSEDPGPMHGYMSTVPRGVREPEFYSGSGPMAICGRRVLVRLAVPFDGEDADACPDCAKRVANGRTGPPPREGSVPRCRHTIEVVDEDDGRDFLTCRLLPRHEGMHRAFTGESWEHSADDLVPPPDGYV